MPFAAADPASVSPATTAEMPMDKSPDAFRTISEAAAELDLPQHVLRFWETRFSQIKPLKRGGGRRYYRPDDVALLRGIRHLLYAEGYTIKGVQRIIKEEGLRFVTDAGRALAAGQAPPAPAAPAARKSGTSATRAPLPAAAVASEAVHADDAHGPGAPEPLAGDDDAPDAPSAAPAPSPASGLIPQRGQPLPQGQVSMVRHGLRRQMAGDVAGPFAPLTEDDRRRLQAVLFELNECKRTLERSLLPPR
jgi:DNA-binding transcriptional MerR regulator